MRFFVLAGTKDGRELAKAIQDSGHEVLLSTLTEYGASLAREQALETRYGALDEQQLVEILSAGTFDGLVDATHPYAQSIQTLAKKVCAQVNVPYYRWQRPQTVLRRDERIEGERVYWVNDIPEGAELAARLGNRILLTTGSHTLDQWVACPSLSDKEVFIRVLPTHAVIKRCELLGFKPYQIIGAQGPFSREFNEVLLKDLQIEVLIAKDSGKEGGTPEKIEACQNLKIPLILLKRPGENQENKPFEFQASESQILESQTSEPQGGESPPFSEFIQKLSTSSTSI